MDEDLNLVPESRYRIESLASRDNPMVTEGTFKGLLHVGNGIVAIAIDMDDGMRRVIPTHMILAIDILSVPEPVEDEEDNDMKSYYS